MNPNMGKDLAKLGSLTLVWQPILEKENWIQTNVDLEKDWLYKAIFAQDKLH